MIPPGVGRRARLEARLLRFWFSDDPALPLWALPLRPLAALTAHVARGRRRRIDADKRARRSDARRGKPAVVVVGNLVVGGGGKTPLCLALAGALRDRGWRPGLLVRGDGAGAGGPAPHRVDPSRPDPARDGDEATLLAMRSGVPVVAGRDRGAALAELLRACPAVDVVLSDDGLQHVGLPRDFEIVVFDRRGLGNGRTLPLGPLREPADAIGRFDALVTNRGWDDRGPEAALPHPRVHASRIGITGIVPLAVWRAQADGAGQPPHAHPPAEAVAARLAGGSVGAVAGIAHPEGFFAMLAGLGLRAQGYRPGDHRSPDARWWRALPEDAILMTEKDAVKCPLDDDGRMHVVCIEARPDPSLISWLDEALRGQTTA